jgi:triacylglycerol lipase
MSRPFEDVIRKAGTAIDPQFARVLYAPALEKMAQGGSAERDLAYGPHARHKLDVYRPLADAPAPAGGYPVLIFLHGGGFLRGDKADRENFGRYFSRHGVLTIVPNYRLAPESHWPSGAEDASSVFAWAREHAARHGGNPQRIVIAGESAGAAHVAAATLVKRFHPAGGLRPAGIALISGVYNAGLELRARQQFGILTPDPRNEAYFGEDLSRHASMSTVELIDAEPVPMLISYAELDPPQMQVQSGELFARLVTRHGYAPQINVVPGHNHLTQVYSVNTGDESLSATLLKFVLDRES